MTAGQFGNGVAPIAAAPLASGGYEVAWTLPGGQFTVWNTDANGNYVSSAMGAVGASDPTLEELEPSFSCDLNGDGTTGLKPTHTIETDGALSLVVVGNEYVLDTGTAGPTLKYLGVAVTAGQFGSGVAPIAAAPLAAGGYEVAWTLPGGQFTVWNTDANGNYVSSAMGAVGASDPTLQELEPSFGRDLNGDGTTGLKPTHTIETDGALSLVVVGNEYVLDTGTAGPTLKYLGVAVTAGQFGSGVAPIAAAPLAAGGYEVAWTLPGGQFTVWNTDANGNYVSSAMGAVGASDPTLQELEPSFGRDLNGDGTTGLKPTHTIETDGAPSLAVVGNEYVLDAGTGGPTLKYQGAAVTAGQFAAAWRRSRQRRRRRRL